MAADANRRAYAYLTTWTPATPKGASAKREERAARPQPPTRYKGGDVVWHAKFGEGVVISARVEGGMEQVDVLFTGAAGQKTIIADFLKPVGS